ncbi:MULTISPECIES: ATP-binding protein [unclassified Lysinibacillus]|uniref:ATP-binding protein n=1 Tax=Lysinibacillus sp. SG55 TaxID=1500270 RepID=UPI000B7C71F9
MRNLDSNSNIYSKPIISVNTHPITNGDYYLATNEISRLYEYITKWIRNRLPGAIVYGYPRMGKTRAVNYVKTILFEELGPSFPIHHITCRTRKNPNENFFFEDLLVGIQHELALVSNKANVKRSRLLNSLVEQAEVAATNKVIFFLDDAQNLFEIEYKWLMDLYNELALYNIQLITFLIGQKELMYQRTAYRDGGKYQIVGRFMSQDYEFKGLQDLEDIEDCLSGYDEYSEYPANSGWSYTRFYFPQAFSAGFRLSQLAPIIWEVVSDLRRKNQLKSTLDIPMQYFVLLIENILLQYGTDSGAEFDIEHISKEQIENLWLDTGYIEWEIHGRN